MEEKRKHLRTEINEPAYVSSGGSVMGCMVRNISGRSAGQMRLSNTGMARARLDISHHAAHDGAARRHIGRFVDLRPKVLALFFHQLRLGCPIEQQG